MLALMLSSSLSSSPLTTSGSKQGNAPISNISFYDTDLKTNIEQPLFVSILGLSKGKSYSDQYIADRISKLEELVPYKVSEWKLRPKGDLQVNVFKKKKIAQVVFVNNNSIRSSKLFDEIGLKTEDAYCDDLCPVIVNKIMRYYADQGFYNASADLKQEQLKDGRLKITVDITENEPAVISSVSLESEGIMSVQELEKMLNIKQGDKVRYSYVQERLKRLREYLFNSSCYAASIYKNSIKVAKDAKSAAIEIGVKTGPRFDIVFRGNDTFPNQQTLKKVIDITATDVVSRDYYSFLVKKIEDFYYSMGFVEPKVDVIEALSNKPWELKLIFNIKEGPKKYFRNVSYNIQRAPCLLYTSDAADE